ncbi:MAG: type I methionyl aminopeptidase [Pirellulales bacterium]|nr:type I methionyl aminopeptidase [Pirellulales bacterium]
MTDQPRTLAPGKRLVVHRYHPPLTPIPPVAKAPTCINLRSPRELAQMRKSGLVVWAAHRVAKALVRPGITTAEIDAGIDEYLCRHDAIPLFKGVPGVVPFPASTCISVNDEVVHGIPGRRRLKEGDIVSLDTGCKVNGWCGDSAYTHAVGRVTPEVQRLLDVTSSVLELAIELMAVKSRWSEVACEMGAYVRDHGFSVVENFVGHGIGRDMHEEPQVPNFVSPQMKKNHDFRLEPGLVIAVEPMVNMGTKRTKTLADHWTQVTNDGQYSAHFEHTVALTKDGPWVLTQSPQPGEEFDDAVLREMLDRMQQPVA